MRRNIILFVGSLVVLSAGCQKGSVTEPPQVASSLPIHTIRDVPADTGSTGRYTYFSFKDSTAVTGVDTATTKWDVAFSRTTIRTNSGSSGVGQGGAIVLSNTDFNTLSQAPSSGYATDTSATQLAITTGSDRGWYHYDFATNIVTPIAGRVLVIRTGDGKYAKVQIVSYYKGSPSNPAPTDQPRYYTFKYVYQPDGSQTLK